MNASSPSSSASSVASSLLAAAGGAGSLSSEALPAAHTVSDRIGLEDALTSWTLRSPASKSRDSK